MTLAILRRRRKARKKSTRAEMENRAGTGMRLSPESK
jgi:hypothetical protein